jgi:F-type H+-transporting ATPase subunit delta
MALESVARRYARAVSDLARERGEPLERWLADLRSVELALSDPTISSVLSSPQFTFAEKREIVDRGIGQLDELRRNLVYMLIEGGRVEAIGALVRELQRLVNEQNGVAEATITTAVPLSDADAERIAQRVGQMLGKRVIAERAVDPSIIGGVVIRVGDTLINGSVAGRLAALREQLV